MKDGLAVRSDDAEPARLDAKFVAGAQRGFAEKAAEAEIELAEFTGRDAGAFGNPQHFGAHGGGEGHGDEILETRVRRIFLGLSSRWGRDAHQSDVDAIDRSAGHEAE